MKKFLYLCGMMLLSLNIMAQIDQYDLNWDTVIYDDFNSINRGWNTFNFHELTSLEHPSEIWWCAAGAFSPCTVFTDEYHHQVYQPSQCIFENDVLNIVSEYVGEDDLSCADGDYILPQHIPGAVCENCEQVDNNYLSGMIQSLPKSGFGYYEIRYKTPAHRDAHVGFWLFGGGPNSYEEIDIMEYSNADSQDDVLYGYSSGIWHNPNGVYAFNPSDPNNQAINYAKTYYHLSSNEPDLSEYHTYGLEWMPDYVKWYRDGNLVSEYRDSEHIPQYRKWILVTYEIGTYYGNLSWFGTDELVIDYIKTYKLKTNCSDDVFIRTTTNWQNYYPSVKRSISIGSTNGLIVPQDSSQTFRAVESIIIDQPFELPLGVQMSFIVQECPENL